MKINKYIQIIIFYFAAVHTTYALACSESNIPSLEQEYDLEPVVAIVLDNADRLEHYLTSAKTSTTPFDINKQFEFEDNNGSLLYIACFEGSTTCTEFLLKHEADVNVKNKKNETPLHAACENNHADCVKLLLDHKVEVNLTNSQNNTPLHIACFYDSIESALLLLNHGAQSNVKNIVNNTPPTLAKIRGHFSLANFLNAEEKPTTWTDKECSLCLNNFNDGEHCFKFSCGHMFHVRCWTTWEKNKEEQDNKRNEKECLSCFKHTNIETNNTETCRKIVIIQKPVEAKVKLTDTNKDAKD